MLELTGELRSLEDLDGNLRSLKNLSGDLHADSVAYIKQIIFGSRFEFPNIGYENILYVAKDEGVIYIWDITKSAYLQISTTPEQIKFIDGGDSNG